DGDTVLEVCVYPDAAEDFYLACGRLTEAMPVRAGDTLTVTMELICVRPKVREGESYKWLVNT
ncbi:MAG: hypothetical protein LBH51_05485, partial [Treponema sp.]|nr:hypothetical protein [Treponema sp.]